MKKLFAVISIAIAPLFTFGQLSQDQNYVHTTQYKTPVQDGQQNTVSDANKTESVTYYDGLGRTKQSIAVKQGGSKESIIMHYAYDTAGRQTKNYMPYAKNATVTNHLELNTNALQKTKTFYNTIKYENTINPYTETKLEHSSLARPIEQAAQGNDWSVQSGHTVKLEYKTNVANEVKRYKVSYIDASKVQTQLLNAGYYKPSVLYKTVVKNENWVPNTTSKAHTTETFKDKFGRIVLKRAYANNVPHDTHYVYDTFGNLTYVLPPLAADQTTINAQNLNNLCYSYHYDSRNRMVEIKVPGKGWEYVVYDKLNRPILTQNAKQRLKNKWLFIKYDIFSRAIYTGKYTYNPTGTADNAARLELQTTVNAQQNPAWYETKESTNSNLGIVYTNTAFPNTAANIELLTINYYDNYHGVNELQIQLMPNAQILGQTITANTKTLATASKVKVLGTNQWSTYVTYYDKKARPIYTASKNEYLNTIDVIKNKLDFSGRVLTLEKRHIKDNQAAITTLERYTYDHASRLLTQTQSINGATPELIVSNTYDELGRIAHKKIGGAIATLPENANGLQTVDYSFNIRGWLKTINNGMTNNGDVFGFKLNYNKTVLTGAKALYNGNISETHFVSANDNKRRSYAYLYDALNRLKKATYHGNHKVPGLTVKEDFTLKNVSYDKNGNITALERMGLNSITSSNTQSVTAIDKLTYYYAPNTNQLTSVSDTATATGFKNSNTTNNDYQYDVNGNTIVDKNKGITNVEYNYLDLPTKVTFNNNTAGIPNAGVITYVYDALGTKLKKASKPANISSVNTTYYAGNMVYTQNNSRAPVVLQFVGTNEGYAEPNGQGGYNYTYQYRDHLGNIRVSYSDLNGNGTIEASTEIIQSKNYYPFGLDHNYGANSPMSAINGRNHKFKYNGQEEDTSFGLNVTEMTFRQYDMALGRFNGIDKMAAYNYNITPYHFGANNPVYFSDPSGLLQTVPDWAQLLWDLSADEGSTIWTNDRKGGFYSGGSSGGSHWQKYSGFEMFFINLFGGNRNGTHSGGRWISDSNSSNHQSNIRPNRIDLSGSGQDVLDSVIQWAIYIRKKNDDDIVYFSDIVEKKTTKVSAANKALDAIGGGSKENDFTHLKDGKGNSVNIGVFPAYHDYKDSQYTEIIDVWLRGQINNTKNYAIRFTSRRKNTRGNDPVLIYMNFIGKDFYDNVVNQIVNPIAPKPIDDGR